MLSLPPLASPSAGHITSNDQLTAYLTSAFSSGPHTVLLFLQDKVSPWGMETKLLLSSKHGIQYVTKHIGAKGEKCWVEGRLWGFHWFHCSSIRNLVFGYVHCVKQGRNESCVVALQSHVTLCNSLLILVWQWALALLPPPQFPCSTSLESVPCTGWSSLWLIYGIDWCFSFAAVFAVLRSKYFSNFLLMSLNCDILLSLFVFS